MTLMRRLTDLGQVFDGLQWNSFVEEVLNSLAMRKSGGFL